MISTIFVLVVISILAYATWLLDSEPARLDRERFATTKDWARKNGLTAPIRPGHGANFLVAVGMLVGFLPGILVWVVVKNKRISYEKQMRELKTQWIKAGKPT